ncbi:MAG: zinc-ribbon domain-containing protein, partial [Coriobacteriales bacterium]|nr:zinc-ribbon domain-containing protein [Coriobacteriales bacterium]
MTLEQAEREATRRNADLVKIIPGAVPGQELYITRCRGCGLLSVERRPENHEKCRPLKTGMTKSSPVASGTSSTAAAAPEKTYPVTPNQRASAREFQSDNHLAFLDDLSWWDFSRNDNIQLFSLTSSSRKPAFSFCSECGLSFEAPVRELLNEGTARYVGVCPDCARRRRDSRESLWRQYRSSVIADYPELLACWDDDESPLTAVVGSHLLRK